MMDLNVGREKDIQVGKTCVPRKSFVKGKMVNLQGSGCKGSLLLYVEEEKGLPGGHENSLYFHTNCENENTLNMFGTKWLSTGEKSVRFWLKRQHQKHWLFCPQPSNTNEKNCKSIKYKLYYCSFILLFNF